MPKSNSAHLRQVELNINDVRNLAAEVEAQFQVLHDYQARLNQFAITIEKHKKQVDFDTICSVSNDALCTFEHLSTLGSARSIALLINRLPLPIRLQLFHLPQKISVTGDIVLAGLQRVAEETYRSTVQDVLSLLITQFQQIEPSIVSKRRLRDRQLATLIFGAMMISLPYIVAFTTLSHALTHGLEAISACKDMIKTSALAIDAGYNVNAVKFISSQLNHADKSQAHVSNHKNRLDAYARHFNLFKNTAASDVKEIEMVTIKEQDTEKTLKK